MDILWEGKNDENLKSGEEGSTHYGLSKEKSLWVKEEFETLRGFIL